MNANAQSLPTFKNYGWSYRQPFESTGWGTSTAVYPQSDSNYFVFSCDGVSADPSVLFASEVYHFSGLWTYMPKLKAQFHSYFYEDTLFCIGGVGSGSTTGEVDKMDFIYKNWSLGAAMPIPVAFYGSGLYNDSLVYCVGGQNGARGFKAVQIYNLIRDKWTLGTPIPGDSLTGTAVAILKNKIVVAGGYDTKLKNTIDQVLIGTIDTLNPAVIQWTVGKQYPFGAINGIGAGVNNFRFDSLFYFAGGIPLDNGEGAVIDSVYAYNPWTDTWMAGPSLPTRIGDNSQLPAVIYNDSIFLVCARGWDGKQPTSVDQWLNLGPVTLPNATGINTAGTIEPKISESPNPYTSTSTLR